MLDIRLAAEPDAETVARLIRQSFVRQAELLGLTPTNCPSYVAFETAAGVGARIESGIHVALAFRAGVPIGTVSCGLRQDGECGEVTRLAVLPEHRRNAYGRELMGYAEQYALAKGATAVELSIVAQFQKLQTYYEELGYSVRTRKLSSLPFELLFLEKQFPKPSWKAGRQT